MTLPQARRENRDSPYFRHGPKIGTVPVFPRRIVPLDPLAAGFASLAGEGA